MPRARRISGTLGAPCLWALLLLAPMPALAQQRLPPTPPVCAVGQSLAAASARSRAAATTATWTIALLPIDVRNGSRNTQTMTAGLADALAYRLGTHPRIDVRDRGVLSRRLSPAAPVADVRAIGADLSARFVLSGSVDQAEGGIVSLWLFDTQRGERVWQRAYRFEPAGPLAVERAAASDIAAAMLGAVSDADRARLVREPTRSRAAYEAYLRGRQALGLPRPDLARAATELRSALTLDPSFSDAHATLALVYATATEQGLPLGGGSTLPLERGVASSTRAIELDSTLARGWLARARLLDMNRSTDAQASFARAMALDPRDPEIHLWLGVSRMRAGDQTGAATAFHRSSALAPGRAAPLVFLAEQAMLSRRDAEACALLNRAIVAEPLAPHAWAARALLRSRNDDLRFAWVDAEIAERLGARVLGVSAAAIVDMVSIDSARARSRLRSMWAVVRARGAVSALEGRYLALAMMAAGDTDRTIGVLERVRPRGAALRALLAEPRFAALRGTPRVDALVASVADPPPKRSSKASRPGGARPPVRSAASP